MNFNDFKLNEAILTAVKEQGYTTPSPIQQKAIPLIMQGEDVMAAAQTGTGKTAGFTLPLLHRLNEGKPAGSNQARALILAPTRELAAQVFDNVQQYGKHLSLRANVVFGGVKINPQMMKLRRGTDVLIATPGRLLDLYNQNAIRFDHLEVLVLDEADRMLDMGFIHDIKKILALLPKRRQTLMFSATFSDEIRKLARQFLTQPKEVAVSPSNSTAQSVKQLIHPVDKAKKAALLTHLVELHNWFQVLVFVRTKHGANKLTKQLNTAGIGALAIHGNKSQGARTNALAQFKAGEIQVLVATDIAARGLDIDQLPHVINFDLPNVPEDYVHRIGRTGRAGATGEAISLVSADEAKQLQDIERLIGKKIEREYVDDFDPIHEVPASKSTPARKPVRRPKKNKPTNNSNQPRTEAKRPPRRRSKAKPKNAGRRQQAPSGAKK
jgi:ATP-dependent RNA helicase RhlE